LIDDPIHEAVHRAFAEDLGESSDLTTEAIVPDAARGVARVIAKEEAVLAGTEVLFASFRELDHDAVVEFSAKDGDVVRPGDVIATIEGSLRAILTAERTALNFLMRLSGVATITRRFVEAAGGVEVKDTRKTIPGMRVLEKAAVRSGGGVNHRMGLSDSYLIKDNHIAAAGSVTEAIVRARTTHPSLWIEVECETLEQVTEALEAGAHELLLDNMDVVTMAEAVRLARGRAKTEASGGVTLETIGDIARTGVDSVSVGALTHSAPAVDFSLEVAGDAPRG
jgi:nicotinate-nucleotide pyrophosphorylase (carboxylating)